MSRFLWIAVALAAAALFTAGCGGGDKPAFCSDVDDLQGSVGDLKNVQLSDSDSLSTLRTQLKTVKTNANTVVSSAKADFPSETKALKTSVTDLGTAVERLPAAPDPAELTALAPLVRSVSTAAKGLDSATTSACD
jgi:hypothetical protein